MRISKDNDNIIHLVTYQYIVVSEELTLFEGEATTYQTL